MVVPERWLVRDDTELSPEAVATLPMPLITCVRAVKKVGGVKAGDRVLIHGGASGTGATIELRRFFFTQKQIRGTLMGDVEDLAWGLEQVKAGRVKPTLDRVYDLRNAAAAHARLAEGTARGSLVLKP